MGGCHGGGYGVDTGAAADRLDAGADCVFEYRNADIIYVIREGVGAVVRIIEEAPSRRSIQRPWHLCVRETHTGVWAAGLRCGVQKMGSVGRVLVVEDEAFTRNLVAGALAGLGWSVESCGSIAEAMALIEAMEPNAVVADLDLGEGPTGVDLCQRLARDYPWVGLVVLTAHTSPDLAVSSFDGLPDEVVYVVKSAVQSPEDLSAAVTAAIGGRARETVVLDPESSIEISREQGEVLRLLAAAYSNAAIAQERGTTLRAAEAMVQRLFNALGIETSPAVNGRVQAAAMWNSGRIVIR